MKTLSAEQFKGLYGNQGDKLVPSIPPAKGFVEDVSTSLSKRGETVNKVFDSNQNFVSKALQLTGQGAGFAGDIIGAGVKKIGDVTGITEAVKPTVLDILNTDIGKAGIEAIKSGMDSYNQWKEANPEIAGNLEAVINIGSLLPLGKAGKVVGQTAVDTAEGIAKIGANAIESAKPAIETVGNIATGVKDITQMTIEGAKNIPSRIATNVAEKQATREAIQQLPTQVAKNAVQNGVDINDVKYLTTITKEQKEPLKKLLKATIDFDSGVSKTNPIEVVGEPIVKRIKALEGEANSVGKKLGDVANNLGDVTEAESKDIILNKLKSINGLSDISINKDGVLDFTNTALNTIETASDRNAIQSIFSQAIKDGTGKQKHLLRQELFEILGGKKKSGISMTDTQDKAYQAIRQGLSDVLDTKSDLYKKLNTEYAKIISPVQNMKRLLKSNGFDEDLANMSAGLLARRLTSMAKSNPEIRNLLRQLDNASSVKGKSSTSVENLQDFYNLLDKYYSIEGKTALQGQIKTGIEKASGVQDVIMQSVGQIAGKTDAVKRKAIEDLLKEVLR